jgi:hypothetical protein
MLPESLPESFSAFFERYQYELAVIAGSVVLAINFR